MYYVKFRIKGQKAWWFVGRGGEGTRKRVHAIMFKTREDAEREASGNATINPEFDFKVTQ